MATRSTGVVQTLWNTDHRRCCMNVEQHTSLCYSYRDELTDVCHSVTLDMLLFTHRKLHTVFALVPNIFQTPSYNCFISSGLRWSYVNDSVMHFRSYSRKRNINTLVTVTVTVTKLITLNNIVRRHGHYFALLRLSITSPFVKLDPYCRKQNCRPKNLVSGYIWLLSDDWERVRERKVPHLTAKMWLVQHCAAISAIAELL